MGLEQQLGLAALAVLLAQDIIQQVPAQVALGEQAGKRETQEASSIFTIA